MADVIAFPNRKLVSKEIEEKVYKVARDYVDILYEAMEPYAYEDDYIDKMTEINTRLAMIYREGLDNAIEELDWDSE